MQNVKGWAYSFRSPCRKIIIHLIPLPIGPSSLPQEHYIWDSIMLMFLVFREGNKIECKWTTKKIAWNKLRAMKNRTPG